MNEVDGLEQQFFPALLRDIGLQITHSFNPTLSSR
jgi:hypothetical protein